MKPLSVLIRNRRTAALLFFFPIALQLHLEALSAMSFVYLPLALIFIVFVVLAGVVISLMRLFQAHTSTDPSLHVAAYVALAMVAGSVLQGTQYAENIRRGNVVARTIETYRDTHSQWPTTLEILDIDLPRWRYGVLNYDFIYWVDQGQPRLKFCSGGVTGIFYSFETKRWREDTL